MDCPTVHEPADILIYIQGKGIVLKERSVLAFQKSSGKILAYGAEAEQLVQKNMPDVEIVSPLCRGMVADYCVAARLFALLITKALGKGRGSSLQWSGKYRRVVVCVPRGISEVEKKALEDLILWVVRAKKVLIVDTPAEEFIREFQEKAPDEYRKYNLIVGITKDEPECYVEEMLRDALEFAGREQIPRERMCQLLQNFAEAECRHIVNSSDMED